MAKQLIGCLTFNDCKKEPRSFKATDRVHARSVVMAKMHLPNFTEESLKNRGILHVYLDGRQVHPIDQAVSENRINKKPKTSRDSRHPFGLRQLVEHEEHLQPVNA